MKSNETQMLNTVQVLSTGDDKALPRSSTCLKIDHFHTGGPETPRYGDAILPKLVMRFNTILNTIMERGAAVLAHVVI